MGLLDSVRGFLRAFRSGAGASRRPRHHGDAIAETADDVLHPSGTVTGGMTDRSRVYDRIADGADDYSKSFEDD